MGMEVSASYMHGERFDEGKEEQKYLTYVSLSECASVCVCTLTLVVKVRLMSSSRSLS